MLTARPAILNSIHRDLNFQETSLLLHFEEATGVIKDSSKYNHSIAKAGNAAVSSPGKFENYSAVFDGSGDNLRVAHSDQLNLPGDFTIELWFNQTSPTETYPILLQKGNDNTISDWGFILDNRPEWKLCQFFWGNPRNYLTFATGISLNQWHHLAVVRISGILTTFFNGVKMNSTPCTNNFTNNNPLIIGMSYTGYNSFRGRVDELRITKNVGRYTKNFTLPVNPFLNY